MNKLHSLALVTIVSLGAFSQSRQDSTTAPELKLREGRISTIAESTKQGVTVCVNQIQIQRIGTNVEMAKHIAKFGVDGKKFARTITLSISKKNNGRSSGPASLTLKNGTKLTPMLIGNQKYMSAIANSSPAEGFDFEENWFELPDETKFDQIFPITMSYQCTDKTENVVQFEFANIFP